MNDSMYDVFISHASEDKQIVAKPLTEGLRQYSLAVWLDEQELRLGDQLRQKINQGLSRSRYGVVILSRAFFAKSWPQEELDALLGKESFGEKIVLPVRHGLSHDEVRSYHPTLANKLSVSTDEGLEHVIAQVAAVVGAPVVESSPIVAHSAHQDLPSGSRAHSSYILETLVDLEERAKVCLGQTMELNDADANENLCPIIAANIASHEEYGEVDEAIRELARMVLKREPTEEEWRSHLQRLRYLRERGETERTARWGYQNQLQWIRLSRQFVRKLSLISSS